MSNIIVFLMFLLGLFLIIKGGDWFVDSSSWMARATGIPSFIVGATIVSFATTLPELLVSVQASLKGNVDIAIGNAVGSTICNIGLISALAFMSMTIDIKKKPYMIKGMIMILSTITFSLLALDNVLTKAESLILIAFLAYFIYYNIKSIRENSYEKDEAVERDPKTIRNNLLKFVSGAIFIIFGARLLVDNGIVLAQIFGVPENIIALTFIALGTSLPELTTTISSIIKKDSAIGVGNIIGANILNINLILTVSSLISKNGLIIPRSNFSILNYALQNKAQTLVLDIPVSVILMLIMIIPVFFRGKISKNQGVLMLLLYFLYIFILITIA